EAIEFLQELSRVVAEEVPGGMLVAEESTAWPGVTRAADAGGLGFMHKWNMGWMHDTLRYISHEPAHRSYHHDDLTFGLLYAFFERFILPISHDEVVYGKRSLLGRMPGDRWQRFANLRVYLAFMWTHPGKKLLYHATRKYQAAPAIATNNAAIAAMSGARAQRFFGSGGFASGAGFARAGTPTASEYARTGSAVFLSCGGPRSV